jgi:hypothetical protein
MALPYGPAVGGQQHPGNPQDFLTFRARFFYDSIEESLYVICCRLSCFEARVCQVAGQRRLLPCNAGCAALSPRGDALTDTVLALDAGTSSVKAALVDRNGGIQGRAARDYS